MSRLPQLVRELARSGPARPVDVSLVVDTGLGAVPKALSTVFSRSSLLTPRTIETAAPVDVDAVWLERVAEFVPDDVVAVVEPKRPIGTDEAGTAAWLDAVRRDLRSEIEAQGYFPDLVEDTVALALAGEDLVDFVAEAVARGAVAVVASPSASVEGAAHIGADEPRKRFADMAARYYAPYPDTIVAVTGTNGKTSTVEMTRQLWRMAGHRSASIGTLAPAASCRSA